MKKTVKKATRKPNGWTSKILKLVKDAVLKEAIAALGKRLIHILFTLLPVIWSMIDFSPHK